jgi:ADP-heptose:LPS heptosyltransferase
MLKPNSSPLKGKYLVQNPLANFILRCVDFFLSLFPKACPAIPGKPTRILITNLAHMGDVLFMTSLVAVLKRLFPEVKIGVVVGSWSLPIVQGHPLIDHIHAVDHWKLNRDGGSLWQKVGHYLRTKKKALAEIRQAKYQVAIDSYFYFPNAIPLLWQAKIPVRIGYISGGFGPLLTHPLPWKFSEQSILRDYIPLIEPLCSSKAVDEAFLSPVLYAPEIDLKALLSKHELCTKQYIVIHMGTGNSLKEWPVSKWKELAQALEGNTLVFTGKGKTEKENVSLVCSAVQGCVDLVDKLSWHEYLTILKQASCLIGVDSLAGHLAAALHLPSVLIYSGMTSLHKWAPQSKLSVLLSHPMPCAPCHCSRGCSSMQCVRGVSVKEVLAHVKSILEVG